MTLGGAEAYRKKNFVARFFLEGLERGGQKLLARS
jgi:hypothetical protein